MSWQHRSTSQEQMKARPGCTPETIGLERKKEDRDKEWRKKGRKLAEKQTYSVWFCIWNILLRYSAPLMLSIVFFKNPSHIQITPVSWLKLMHETYNPFLLKNNFDDRWLKIAKCLPPAAFPESTSPSFLLAHTGSTPQLLNTTRKETSHCLTPKKWLTCDFSPIDLEKVKEKLF